MGQGRGEVGIIIRRVGLSGVCDFYYIFFYRAHNIFGVLVRGCRTGSNFLFSQFFKGYGVAFGKARG